jgi:hypothetical protein
MVEPKWFSKENGCHHPQQITTMGFFRRPECRNPKTWETESPGNSEDKTISQKKQPCLDPIENSLETDAPELGGRKIDSMANSFERESTL